MDLTPDIITGAAAVLLSVLATYLPKFNEWHAALPETNKKLLWMGLLIVTTLGAVTWSCEGGVGQCFATGWRDYVTTFIGSLLLGIGANQGTHKLLPEPHAVQQAKLIGQLRRGRG